MLLPSWMGLLPLGSSRRASRAQQVGRPASDGSRGDVAPCPWISRPALSFIRDRAYFVFAVRVSRLDASGADGNVLFFRSPAAFRRGRAPGYAAGSPLLRCSTDFALDGQMKQQDGADATRVGGEAAMSCSFCQRRRDQVRYLLAGSGVNICEVCVATCVDSIADSERAQANRPASGSRFYRYVKAVLRKGMPVPARIPIAPSDTTSAPRSSGA